MSKFALAMAVVVGVFAGTRAEAGISFDIVSSLSTGPGTTGVAAVSIDHGVVNFTPDGLGNYFQVQGVIGGQPLGGPGSIFGAMGKIEGAFKYTSVASGGSSADEVASLTDTDLTPNLLKITDSDGNTFSAEIAGITLARSGSGATVNFTSTINLSNFSYVGGTNADLLQFKSEAEAYGGFATVTFQMKPSGSTLASLLISKGDPSSFSGTVSTAPEPSSLALACTGAALIGLARYRKRRRDLV